MTKQKITPHLWFDTEAVEAASFYSMVFPDSEVTFTTQIRDTPSGDCDIVGFRVMGYDFMAISAGTQWLYPASIGALQVLRERRHCSQSRKWSAVSTGAIGWSSLVSLLGLIAPALEQVGARQLVRSITPSSP